MRVSDDRYSRDRERLDLAVRLIRHEARTFTIRQWTGLSDDRIRKLYRSYVMGEDERRVRRHRGKSPRQAAFFFRSAEMNFHAAQLASLFLMYGLLRSLDTGEEPRHSTGKLHSGALEAGSLEAGLLLCQAYEVYVELHSPARISFEHAWFLLIALTRREELALARCPSCGGVRLRDLLSRRRLACGNCESAGMAAAPG
jgi:ribosomal protein S27AE